MAIITATAVLNFAYPSGGGSSGDWQQPQDPCVVAGGPTVFGGQCSDAKQNGLSYDTLQRIIDEAVSGLRPTDVTLTNDLTSGIFERLQELRQPVGDAESLAMLTRMLADVQTNGDDPATLASIREFLESGQTRLTGPLQTIMDRLLSGDLDGALGELSDLIAELQASSGSPEEIARLEDLLKDGASRQDAAINDLRKQLDDLRNNGEDPAIVAQLEKRLQEQIDALDAQNDLYLTADQMADTLRAELDRLRASMADPARITALEKRLDALTTNPSSAQGGASGSGAASSTISVSIVRSLPCIVGFKRKKPSNLPDLRTLRVITPGLLMAEVTASENFDYTFDFFGKGFSGFSGRIPEGSGKNKFMIDYSVGGGEIRINPSGTNLELASRQNLFVSAVASFKTRYGQDAMEVVRTDRQIEFVDETMPTAVKKKEEVFVEYEVYKIYPNWDTEKNGTDWYIDRKPIKIIYKVWLVFMDPNTGREAGGAGYEYRTEQFTVQPPTGNYKKEPNEKVGEDPGKLWE